MTQIAQMGYFTRMAESMWLERAKQIPGEVKDLLESCLENPPYEADTLEAALPSCAARFAADEPLLDATEEKGSLSANVPGKILMLGCRLVLTTQSVPSLMPPPMGHSPSASVLPEKTGTS
jgi:hypothetical protein